MSCPDLILRKYYSEHPGASVLSTPVVPSLMEPSCTSKLHIHVVLCVTRYSLGLYDINCYSMNGSHTSQGGIPMGGTSQIKTEHFSSPWRLHLPPHPSCISIPLCQNVILCRAPSLSPPRKVGHRPEGALLAPSPLHGNHRLL